MLVFDYRAGRATVLGSDFAAARSIRLPQAQFVSIGLVAWPTVVVNAVIRTTREFGWPLHLLDLSGQDASVVSSFGLNDGVVRPPDLDYLNTRIGVARAGTIWTADELQYRIAEWATNGTSRRILQRKPSWFPGTSTGLAGGPNKPAEPRITALSQDSVGLIWVFTLVASIDYRSHWTEVAKLRLPGGASDVPASLFPDIGKLYDTRIEVVDPGSARVVASGALGDAVIAALPGGRAVAYREDDNGIPRLSVVSLSMRR